MNLGKYSKFVVALVGVVIAAALRHYGTGNELVQDVVLLATALGVYQVPNQK